jgi:TetR/AcrR family transcriptional regulator, cholesterol catabolism regulator
MTAENPPPPGPRLPIGGTSLQSRIAEAAIDLFYNRGAPATTIRDITAACGLTAGALYNHFSSKEELLYVLVRDIHLLADEGLAAAIAGAGPEPAARLAAAVRFMVLQAAGLRKYSLVANREFAVLPPEMQDAVTAVRRQMRRRFAEILRAGSTSGDFVLPGGQDRLTAALTANAIGMLCANISEWTRTDYPVPLDDLQDRYVVMALRLAGAKEPRQQPG